MSSKRVPAVPVRARPRKPTSSTAEAAPPEERAPTRRDPIARDLSEVVDWIEGAREALEDLLMAADDATSKTPLFKRGTNRSSAFEDHFEVAKCLRFAQKAAEAAQGKLFTASGGR